MLGLAKLALGLAWMLYACLHDLRAREVPDWVWLAMACTTTPLTGYEAYVGLLPWQLWTCSALLASTLGLILYYAGAWGGADSKALWCIGLGLPATPRGPHPFTPLACLDNALLLTLAAVPYCLARNLAYRLRHGGLFNGVEASLPAKLLALCFSYRGRSRHAWSVVEGGRLRFKLRVDRLKDAEEGWITPQLPFIAFLALGLALAWLQGDLLWRALWSLLERLHAY